MNSHSEKLVQTFELKRQWISLHPYCAAMRPGDTTVRRWCSGGACADPYLLQSAVDHFAKYVFGEDIKTDFNNAAHKHFCLSIITVLAWKLLQ